MPNNSFTTSLPSVHEILGPRVSIPHYRMLPSPLLRERHSCVARETFNTMKKVKHMIRMWAMTCDPIAEEVSKRIFRFQEMNQQDYKANPRFCRPSCCGRQLKGGHTARIPLRRPTDFLFVNLNGHIALPIIDDNGYVHGRILMPISQEIVHFLRHTAACQREWFASPTMDSVCDPSPPIHDLEDEADIGSQIQDCYDNRGEMVLETPDQIKPYGPEFRGPIEDEDLVVLATACSKERIPQPKRFEGPTDPHVNNYVLNQTPRDHTVGSSVVAPNPTPPPFPPGQTRRRLPVFVEMGRMKNDAAMNGPHRSGAPNT